MRGVTEQLRVIRDAVGPDMGIHLDVNFNFKTEGFKRIADAVAPADLTWLEIDTHDAPALAEIKRGAPCPIASCETLHGRREFKPFLDHYAYRRGDRRCDLERVAGVGEDRGDGGRL